MDDYYTEFGGDSADNFIENLSDFTQYEYHIYYLCMCMALVLNTFKTTNDVTPQITIPRARGMP